MGGGTGKFHKEPQPVKVLPGKEQVAVTKLLCPRDRFQGPPTCRDKEVRIQAFLFWCPLSCWMIMEKAVLELNLGS